jgi:phosphoribosylglycinamide formyltransferase 1
MKRYAVLASGFGSNLQALIDAHKRRRIQGELSVVISDRADARALVRARRAGIPSVFVDPLAFPGRELLDREVVRELRKAKAEYVVLAGYMRILSPYFIESFRNRIINVHPALLPAFKGAHAIKDAFVHGVKTTGVTIHFVDEKVDHGAIIAQEPVAVAPRETLKSLERKIHAVEHKLYPKVVDLLLRGKLRLAGRRVVVGS